MTKFSTYATVVLAMLSASSSSVMAESSASESEITQSSSSGNPYANMKQFAPTSYRKTLEATLKQWGDSDAAKKARKHRVEQIGTGFWLDKSAVVPRLKEQLKAAQDRSKDQKRIVTIVVYNLPNRDCAALASNGELSVANGGLKKYQEYIDSIAKILKEYPDVAVSAVVEPDSLPNLITNMKNPKCQESEKVYKDGIAYAIKKLQLPNVSIYLDIAHAGWLSYPDSAEKAATLYAEVVKKSGGKIRGFATNIANYTPVKGTQPIDQWARAKDESEYVALLAPLLTKEGLPSNFIIDTSRNGIPNARKDPSNWCNIKGAGLGPRPTWKTDIPHVDAFVWVKPPGESDGTSDPNAKRFDKKCASEDSIKNAPEAGVWNPTYYKDLIKGASL